MNTTFTDIPELTAQIAAQFAQIVQETVYSEGLAAIRYRNTLPAYQNACASHDFVDANELMAEAFEEVMGREADLADEADLALWNRSWDKAKREHLTVTFKVGDRVRLVQTVDNFPTVLVGAGATGTISDMDDERWFVRLDEHLADLDEWQNQLEIWNWGEEDGHPATYLEPLTPADIASRA